MFSPDQVYFFLKDYFWHIVCLIFACVGFIMRLRGEKRTSTILFLSLFLQFIYFLYYGQNINLSSQGGISNGRRCSHSSTATTTG